MSKETRDRIAFRMQPETRRRIEQWYAADNCQSKNEFIEKAVNFYVDYLGIQDSPPIDKALSVIFQCGFHFRRDTSGRKMNQIMPCNIKIVMRYYTNINIRFFVETLKIFIWIEAES